MWQFIDKFIKYMADRLIALVAIFFLLPIFLIITVAIKFDSKGSAIFSQARVGKAGAEFKIYKFRTMLTTDIPFDIKKPIILSDDNSLTRIGRFLRKSKLDELPQLFNILVGDMSFVGPRPFMPSYLGDYDRWELSKFNVLTGLTGLSQVNGNGYLSTKERSYYDVEYAKHRSIFMDIGIILKTIMVIFRGEDCFINHISEDAIIDKYNIDLRASYKDIDDLHTTYATNCKRIAQVVGQMQGGVGSCIMNYYRAIDRANYQFDFYTYSPSEYDSEIRKMGGNVYYIPNFIKVFQASTAFKRILESKDYYAVHANLTSLSLFPLAVAKRCGTANRICHAHSTTHWTENTAIIKNILKRLITRYATEFIACSNLASDWFYGKRVDDVTIIPNAISTKKFVYNKRLREMAREKLHLDDKTFVVGTVGRLVFQKNHIYLLKMFRELKRVCANTVLIIVGEGKQYKKLMRYVRCFNLSKSVFILPEIDDICLYYNAFDLFVLPSKYEGLPLVGIEAQCTGLPCIFSDKVTKEVDISTQSRFISTKPSDIYSWIYHIAKTSDIRYNRKSLKVEKFDINRAVKLLQKFYDRLGDNKLR